MREIKFRAWEKPITEDGETYGGVMYFSEQEGEKRRVEIAGFYHDSGWDYEDFVFMQYTGLKDKNGKEIYEGDIVKLDYHWDDGWVRNHEVTWEDGYFNPIGRSGDWYFNPASERDGCEVIGNIYENPELIPSKEQPSES